MSSTEQTKISSAKKRAANVWQKMKAEKPFSIDELYRMIKRYGTRMSFQYQCGDLQEMYFTCSLNSLANRELAVLRAQLEAAHEQQH